MSRAKLYLFLMTLIVVTALDAAEGSPQSLLNPSAGTPSVLAGMSNPTAYSVSDRDAVTYETGGSGDRVTVGYARVQPANGTTPAGYLVFKYRTNGVLVSEATVPESSPISFGRIYTIINGAATTGVAIVNPNSTTATISVYFTDANGQNFGDSSFDMPANSQIANFINELPFDVGAMTGTMTFSSSLPVEVIALQGFTNERGEFLMTTLPVTDLTVAPSSDVLVFPHYATGGGWNTEVVLENPSDATISGTVIFSSFDSAHYAIAPRSAQRIGSPIESPSTTTGLIQVIPDTGSVSPSGQLIFSFMNNFVTVTEAAVPLMRPAGAFRIYAIDGGSYSGQIQTGVAIANPSSTSSAIVTLELTDLAGQLTGMTSKVTLPPQGQTARFMKEFPGFESISDAFQGILRVSTTGSEGIAVIGLRGEYNDRNDFLVTTLMPANEATPSSSAEAFFPLFADGGGFTTEFVLFNGVPGPISSGNLSFYSQSGVPLN